MFSRFCFMISAAGFGTLAAMHNMPVCAVLCLFAVCILAGTFVGDLIGLVMKSKS